MLQLDDITAGYGDAPLFSGLSLSVARGEMRLVPVSYTHLTLPTIYSV